MQRAPPALILAAKNGGVEASRLLLKFGAIIDTVDQVVREDDYSYSMRIIITIYYYRMATLLSTWQ